MSYILCGQCGQQNREYIYSARKQLVIILADCRGIQELALQLTSTTNIPAI